MYIFTISLLCITPTDMSQVSENLFTRWSRRHTKILTLKYSRDFEGSFRSAAFTEKKLEFYVITRSKFCRFAINRVGFV